MSDVIEKRVIVGGVPTRVLEAAGEGPAFLLLHGFTDSADTWRPVMTELAAAGRRSVAVDLPGQGHAPPLEQPIFQNLDAFTAAFVTEYAGEEPVVLAGNSLGGLLAMRAAREERLPIAAVVGLGPAGLVHTRRIYWIAQWAKVLHPFLSLLERLPIPRSVVRRAALRAHRRLVEGSLPEAAAHYAGHFRSIRDVTRLRADLIALDVAQGADVLKPADIRVPVHMIWGKRDGLSDLAGAPMVLDAVPGSTLVVLDCGHLPQAQLPEQVADLLLALPDHRADVAAGDLS